MQCHRIEELLELLQAEWLQDPDLTLLQFLQKWLSEAGFPDELETISDDTLIHQLKMRSRGETEMIPGHAKDAVPDFKEAILCSEESLNKVYMQSSFQFQSLTPELILSALAAQGYIRIWQRPQQL